MKTTPHSLLIKVCGMRLSHNIRAVEALGIDLMGFIFYPRSPRYVGPRPDYLPTHCLRVGVFVNAPAGEVEERADDFGLDLIQLHGNESPDYCRRLVDSGLQLIKVFSLRSEGDAAATEMYEGLCRYFLFDTPTAQYGGSGTTFDWSLLDAYRGDTPFLLSGGIGPGSAESISRLAHPRLAGIDLNSRFETEPGLKDVGRLRDFIAGVKTANGE